MYILIINKGEGWILHNSSPYPTLDEAIQVRNVLINLHSYYQVLIAKYIDI